MSIALYTGEDVEVVVDLLDVNFLDLRDLYVGVIIDANVMKVMKKSEGSVYADSTNQTRCKFKLLRADTRTWPNGMLSLEVTVVRNDTNFPSGRHSIFKDNIVKFIKTLTKDV